MFLLFGKTRYLVLIVVCVELRVLTCDVVGVELEVRAIHGSCTCDLVEAELDVLTIKRSCTCVVSVSIVHTLMFGGIRQAERRRRNGFIRRP